MTVCCQNGAGTMIWECRPPSSLPFFWVELDPDLDEKKENNLIIECVILVFVLQWISSIYSQKKTKKKKGKNSDGPIKVATKNDSPGTRFLDFGLDFGLFWLVNSLFLQSHIGTSLGSQIIVFYFKLGYLISTFKGVGTAVFFFFFGNFI